MNVQLEECRIRFREPDEGGWESFLPGFKGQDPGEAFRDSAISRLLCRGPASSKPDQFGAAFQAQLVFNIAAMGVHCLNAQVELGGDCVAVFALA